MRALIRFLEWLKRLFGFSPSSPPGQFPMLKSAYQFVSELFQKDRPHLILHKIGMSGAPADSKKHYFRVSLAEMYLSDERNWFRTLFPALGTVTRCTFGKNTEELPSVVDPAKLVKPTWGTGLVLRKVDLTPTLPFRGGSVEITAVLKSMTVANHLEQFINTLTEFSTLLAAPQLSAALQVAGPLAKGVQNLFAGGEGKSVLGYIETFDKATLLKGHLAIVAATAGAIDPTKLTVVDHHLKHDGHDLTGVDYMLLHIDVFENRDDFESIASIFDPLQAAIKALETNKPDDALRERNAALRAAFAAPELTEADRRRVMDEIIERYEYMKKLLAGSGAAAADTTVTLSAWVKQRDADEALQRGPLALSQAEASHTEG